jgi:hypothetical protein
VVKSGEERGGKDDLKSSSSLPLHMQGKKENSVVQNNTISGVFFRRKGNECGNN